MSEITERHCDQYIRDTAAPIVLRWWLFLNRLPAIDKYMAEEAGVKPKLFATFKGERVRVVMASRMGDVGITKKLEAENGYDLRVFVSELSDFTDFV